MRKLVWAAYALPILALFATEAAFYLGDWSRWRWYAGLSWILLSVAVVLSAWVTAIFPFFGRYFWTLPHRAWYLTAFFGPPVLILVNGGGIYFTSIDAEGLQQLAAGLFVLHHDPNLGVLTMTYGRYMGRQYVLNCLPSFFLGPSLWAARIGNSMFYIGSYLFFLSALLAYLKKEKNNDPLLFSSYCGIMIAFGQYTLLNARKFEQTTMPVGATLFFLAALLYFVAQPGPLRFLWVTWAFGFFTGCYTPAMGGWVLALAILLYFILFKRQRILIPTVIYGIVCSYIVYRVMQRTNAAALPAEFMVGTVEHFSTRDWIFRYLLGIRAVIGTDFTLIPAPLALAIFGAICLCWRFREYRYAVVCAWAVAIAYLSVALNGSDFAFPNRDIQRAMIIIPPLTLGAVFLLIRHMSASPESKAASGTIKSFMYLSMGYMVFTGIFTVFLVRNFFGQPMPNDEDEALVFINKLVNSSEVQPTKFYLIPPMGIDLGPGLQYFAPDAKWDRANPPAGEKIPGVYVLSYIKETADRFDDEVAPSRHPRPFLKMEKE
jgi:hypothetical protein